jgi:hypothetical protein
VAQSAVLELEFLHLRFIHLVLAALASVVVPTGNRLASHHAGREVAAAGLADSVVLAD